MSNNYADGMPNNLTIESWMDAGDTEKLEQVLLNGFGLLLRDKESTHEKTKEFLDQLPTFERKINAIHRYVEQGDVRRVKALIDRKKLAAARDYKGATPLHNAVLYNQTNTVNLLVSRFPWCVNLSDQKGRTPLHYAAADATGARYITILQKAGGDPFIEDKNGKTAYYYRNHPEEFHLSDVRDERAMDTLLAGRMPQNLLFDLETDIADWLKNGETSKLEDLVLNGYGDMILGKLHEAEQPDVRQFLEVLPQYQAKIREIHRAVRAGNLKEVKSLTDRKKLALARDTRGATALHNAVLFYNIDVVKYFTNNYPHGVNAQDHNRCTPLHYAAALPDGGKCYRILRRAGANPTILDNKGKSPKYYVINPIEMTLKAYRDMSDRILSRHQQFRYVPSYLESKIKAWLTEGNVANLEKLVLSGCGDLLDGRDSRNQDVRTFLEDLPFMLERIDKIHKYVRTGKLEQMVKLIDEKKFALARDRKGATPIHNAVLYGRPHILQFFANNFPQMVRSTDFSKRTPTHYAAVTEDEGLMFDMLMRAGADKTAKDNEGHSPIFYKENSDLLDLQKLRDKDSHLMMEERAESEMTDNAMSSNQDYSESEFEEDMNFPDPPSSTETDAKNFDLSTSSDILPNTETGRKMASILGPVLMKALAEMVLQRPLDPRQFLIEFLFNWDKDNN